MVKSGFAARALLVTWAVLLAAVVTPAATNLPNTPVSGIVRDQLGRALEGAEILVLGSEAGASAVRFRAVSDASGRFVVGAVTPGVYRVAAIKTGYLAALGVVNTFLKSSVDLVLHPAPRPGEPGSERMLEDLSWVLRLPPRGILRETDAGSIVDERATGGAGRMMAGLADAVSGRVEHLVALGTWRPGGREASALQGNETRMRLGGALGSRGAIQVEGHHGSLDSSSTAAETGAMSRARSDLDVDVSYDTGDDASLAMSAFYSKGDLEVGGAVGSQGKGFRHGQRSWGYDAQWSKQVDSSSRVALQVGFHDASLAVDTPLASPVATELRAASNRAVGAEGVYEAFAGEGHQLRFGVRAQRLSLSDPSARIGRPVALPALDGATGWSLLVDAEDQWAITGPVALTYGLGVRQSFDASFGTTVTPRVGAVWTTSKVKASAELSYLAATNLSADASVDATPAGASNLGYGAEVELPVSPTVSVRGTAFYVPLRSSRFDTGGTVADTPYLTDGTASDRCVALVVERTAAAATLSFRYARGRAEGSVAPALDVDAPVVVLSDAALSYDALTFAARAPRAGSALAVEYRATTERALHAPELETSDPLRTVAIEFSQDLVRLGGGRASCRLLLAARKALEPRTAPAGESGTESVLRFGAQHKQLSAGLSLVF